MNHNMIGDLILNDALELYGQPKWTFGKNTCNTYEVFVEKVHMPDGDVMPAWPVVELIERDEALTLLFSRWFLENAMRSACDLTEQTDSNVTLSMNLLPLYADRESFVDDVVAMLKKTGLKPQKMQFEVSEAQDLTERGIANLNALHDEHGIGLWLANFGTGHSNVDLLREVHFDGLELDKSYGALVPGHEQTCRLVVAILHMAHTLDLHVCAKGIENQDQFEFFEELGCFKGQGFLIGKPMDMAQMSDYIRKYAVRRRHGRSIKNSGPEKACSPSPGRFRCATPARPARGPACAPARSGWRPDLPRPFPEPCPFQRWRPRHRRCPRRRRNRPRG